MNAQSHYLIAFVLGSIFFIIVAVAIRYEIICRRAKQKIPDILTHEWIRGRDIRQKLVKEGIHLSYGSFYIVMNHLFEEGKVLKRDTLGADDRIREFRLPLTVEEHRKEEAAYLVHLGR
jgi:hypothetical protein